MLVREINREWAKYGLTELHRVAVEMRAEVELIHRNDDGKFRLISAGFPYWRLGTRGRLNRFDERAFNDTSRPLLTLAAIHHNSTVDLSDWKKECEAVQAKAENEHICRVAGWLAISAPDRWRGFSAEWGLAENLLFLETDREFRSFVGYPAFVPPKLAPSPLKAMPWE